MKLGVYALLMAGMIFYGSATPVSKLVSDVFPIYAGAAARLLFAGLVLLPFTLRPDPDFLKRSRQEWLLIAGVAVIGNLGFSFFMLYGMQIISGVMASVVMSLTPAVTAMGAVLFMNESINKRKIGALALGVSGVLLMHLTSGGEGDNNGGSIWIGSLLVFAAICCEAAYTLLGKVGSNQMKPITLATLSALMSGLLLLPWLVLHWPQDAIQTAASTDWAALIWWGVGTMALGTLCWYRGIKQVPGHIAAGFMVVMPLSALLLSYLLLNEPFEWIHLAGFGFALGGVWLMIVEHRRQAR